MRNISNLTDASKTTVGGVIWAWRDEHSSQNVTISK